MLLNESKIFGRHITFVYAIKDDMFKDEDRAKFFDHIVTVIPFINSSNSKDILKKKLLANGVADQLIPDDAISDMAFFIHDMRMLINIVNEFCQYRKIYNYLINVQKCSEFKHFLSISSRRKSAFPANEVCRTDS